MGQAKNRGTFEQRKAAAIERTERMREEMRKLDAERRANETPQERRERQKARMILASMMAMAEMGQFRGR